MSGALDQAKHFVAGDVDLDDEAFRGLVAALKAGKEWWWARRVLRRVPLSVFVGQQLALCTYKDSELRRVEALEVAWAALFEGREIKPDQLYSAETAGLAGAIAKRRWELDGREHHLRDALRWYDRSAELHDAATRDGLGFDPYGHINAAFVRDVLAHAQSPQTPATDALAAVLRAEARELRDQIVAALEGSPLRRWWQRASLLEAYVGLGHLDTARALIADPTEVASAKPWERESTAVQLLSLAEVTATDPDELQPVLEVLLGRPLLSGESTRSINRRFGIAMSGGGFRAALFHLGVLARLADEGLLHQVEVLSTVSGGSIVGTAYFAHLAQRLAEDGEPGVDRRNDLQHVIDLFVETVSTNNLRMQSFLGPRALLDGLRHRRLGRTRRLGLLLEKHLLGPLRPSEKRRDLKWLQVVPAGERDGFSPKRDNWRRATKVPVVLLNATSLGTGRPWRFTGSWMGEPASLTDDHLDPVTRLEAIWYDRVPGAEARVRIGDAVAASAGVPVLFPPLRIPGLYPARSVALVDGGVYDNQGLSGLLDQDCTDMFVSDASGLLAEKTKLRRRPGTVFRRTNTILMATVRRDTLAEADQAQNGGRIRNLHIVHLLDGIQPDTVTPIHIETETRGPGDTPEADGEDDGKLVTVPAVDTDAPMIDRDVQRALAALRTDLDRFTDAECSALIELGYRLTNRTLTAEPHDLAQPPSGPHRWSFLYDDSWMTPASPRAAELAAAARRGRPVLGKWLPWRRRKLKELRP